MSTYNKDIIIIKHPRRVPPPSHPMFRTIYKIHATGVQQYMQYTLVTQLPYMAMHLHPPLHLIMHPLPLLRG